MQRQTSSALGSAFFCDEVNQNSRTYTSSASTCPTVLVQFMLSTSTPLHAVLATSSGVADTAITALPGAVAL